MNTTLDSLANKNEDAFRSVFADKKSADAFMYLFGKNYYFDKIGSVEQDKAGRVQKQRQTMLTEATQFVEKGFLV